MKNVEAKMEKRNLKDRAYDYIKERIIRCVYAPGTFLVESELIEGIGASRTPIREALNKLEQEHLIKIFPKRGVMVENVTMADINDVYEVRFMIEPPIVRKYGKNIRETDLKDMFQRNVIAANSGHGFDEYDLDNELHNMFLSACGNHYLVEMMNRIFAQNHRLRILSGEKLEYRVQESLREHISILNALLNTDYEGAEIAMRKHLEKSQDAAFKALSQNVNVLEKVQA